MKVVFDSPMTPDGVPDYFWFGRERGYIISRFRGFHRRGARRRLAGNAVPGKSSLQVAADVVVVVENDQFGV